MFDFSKTVQLIRGGLFDPFPTWEQFLDSQPDYKTTLVLLAAPLIVSNVILSVVLSRSIGGFSTYGIGQGWFIAILMGIIMMSIGLALATLVFTALAGVFGGKTNWQRGFAAMSLVIIPAVAGSIVGALIPIIGGLITLAGAIIAAVYTYRIMPLAYDIPEGKRPLHFVISLVLLFISNLVVITILGLSAINHQLSINLDDEDSSSYYSDNNSVFSGLERQAKITEDAADDQYTPPSNGKVSESQVQLLVRTMEKTKQLVAREEQRIKELAESIESKEEPSISDMSNLMRGIGSAVGAYNAEMEVVKTADGNWAEHEWVKNQLRIAAIQQDGSKAIEHNYALYKKYEEELSDWF